MIQESIFLCNPNRCDLVSSSLDGLENLATQKTVHLKMIFLKIETAIKSRLSRILKTPNQRRSHCVATEAEDDNSSTQFLQIQKKQLRDLQKHFERYCHTLPVFGFKSARYDINIIYSYLLPILVTERDIESIVIKKTNQFVSFNFGKVHLLNILNLLGGATNLDSFLKAYKASETKGLIPHE